MQINNEQRVFLPKLIQYLSVEGQTNRFGSTKFNTMFRIVKKVHDSGEYSDIERKWLHIAINYYTQQKK